MNLIYNVLDLKKVTFRVSAHDPTYYLPSIANLIVEVNLPPKFGVLNV
jgi:hypothetical protein